jgi:hypothetical protein
LDADFLLSGIPGTVITSCFQLALQEFLQQQQPRRAQFMVLIELCVLAWFLLFTMPWLSSTP